MTQEIISELEALTQKIEKNTASLADYKRYEALLQNGGLSHGYIFSYLNRAGFKTWEDLITARQQKQKDYSDGTLVGGLIGLGLGILLLGALGSKE